VTLLVGVASLWLQAACGGGAGSKPDTGYGAMQPVPATINCIDLCQREGDCFEHLCNEDTKSTRYTGAGTLLVRLCEESCTDTQLMSRLASAPQKWTCLFQSTCRMAIGNDSCDADASYSCQ
jgi:hypothetical protein